MTLEFNDTLSQIEASNIDVDIDQEVSENSVLLTSNTKFSTLNQLKKNIQYGRSLKKTSIQSDKKDEIQIQHLPSYMVENIIDLLSDHLEYTKLNILKSLNIALSTTEKEFMDKFFVNTEVDLDSEMEYLSKYWSQEFMLRLKSKQQLLVDDYIPIEKSIPKSKNEEELLEDISILKEENANIRKALEQKNQEIFVLEAMVERREKMIEDNRKTFFKELLLLKEDHFKQLLNGNFEFLENEKLMDDIPRDLQTISMYYNADAVLKGLKRIKALEEEVEMYNKMAEASKQYEKQLVAREEEIANKMLAQNKEIQKKEKELIISKQRIIELNKVVDELNETVAGCQSHYEDVQMQLEEMEKVLKKKNDKILELKNADQVIEKYRQNIENLVRDVQRYSDQVKRFRKQARERDKFLVKIQQLKFAQEDLEARILSNYDSEAILEKLKNYKFLLNNENFDDIDQYMSEEDEDLTDLLNQSLNHDININSSTEPSSLHGSTTTTPRYDYLHTKYDKFTRNNEDSLMIMNRTPNDQYGFTPMTEDSSVHSIRPTESDEDDQLRYTKPTIPRVGNAKKKVKRLKRLNKPKSSIGRWTENEENHVHTPKSDRRVSVHTLFSPSLPADDISESFANIANSLNEFGAIDDTMSNSNYDDIIEPNRDLLVSAEEMRKLQKERAEYLLKQYYMLRKRDDILQRLENRTKIMYDRVKQKKEQLEKDQLDQLERCLNVYQLLSKSEELVDETSPEMQELKRLKEHYDSYRRQSEIQQQQQLRPMMNSPGTISDPIRPPSTFGVIAPGSQNRYHVVKRKLSIDDRSMDEMFICRQMNGTTPPPRPQTSFAPLKRPHSSANYTPPPNPSISPPRNSSPRTSPPKTSPSSKSSPPRNTSQQLLRTRKTKQTQQRRDADKMYINPSEVQRPASSASMVPSSTHTNTTNTNPHTNTIWLRSSTSQGIRSKTSNRNPNIKSKHLQSNTNTLPSISESPTPLSKKIRTLNPIHLEKPPMSPPVMSNMKEKNI